MKTRNLYYAMALVAGTAAYCAPANAQDVFVDEATTVTEFTCDNTTRYFSNWRNNWFIEVEAGINQPFVERGNAKTPGNNVSRHKMTLTYGVGFGTGYLPTSVSVSRLSAVPFTGTIRCSLISPTDGAARNM